MPHKKNRSLAGTAETNAMGIHENMGKKQPAGLYLRISGEEAAKGEKLNNQRDLLLSYVKSRNDLMVADIYSDNGETGTNFDRPEWNRLMEDVRKKRISCIVVKDLSRFGRNYIETGNYLETVFPLLNVRFIAVNDCYDSDDLESSSLQPLDVMIKGIVNEAYAKDISRKIFTTKELQRKKGLYYGNIPPYGYCRDMADHHHLIVNPETAPTVQQIFQWKLEGMGNFRIARILNESGIPAPMRYQFLIGAVKSPRYENSIWQGVTVKALLGNRTYTGDLALGKRRKNLSNNQTKIKNIPYESWIITENTHEGIISRDTFFEVQRICMRELEKNRASRYCHSNIEAPEDIFAGLVYSGSTGLKMYRTRNYYEKHGMKYRYSTISQRDKSYSKCPLVSIREELLAERLTFLLEKQMTLIMELKEYIARVQTHPAFLGRKEEMDEHLMECFSPDNPCIRIFTESYKNGSLSKDLLQRLVEKIYVYDSKTVEVVFKYQDKIEPVLKFRERGVLV